MNKKTFLAVAVQIVLLLNFASAGYCTESVQLSKNFRFFLNDLCFTDEGFLADEYYLYFKAYKKNAVRPSGSSVLYYRIQLNDGNCDYGDSPLVSDKFTAEICVSGSMPSPKRLKNMSCDAEVTSTLNIVSGKSAYVAAIARDWHLYIFDEKEISAGRKSAIYKTQIGEKPLQFYKTGNFLIVVTGNAIIGYELSYAPGQNKIKLISPNVAGMNSLAAIRLYASRNSEINDFDMDVQSVSNSALKFYKMAADVQSFGKLYMTAGIGEGNVNLYSVDENFNIGQLTNFKGRIADFKVTSDSSEPFLIYHLPAYDANDESSSCWIVKPDGKLKKPQKAIALYSRGAMRPEKCFYSAYPLDSGGYYRVEPDGETSGAFLLNKIDYNNSVEKKAAKFNMPLPARKAGLYDCAAVSAETSRPYVALYSNEESRFYVYDVLADKLYDSFYFNCATGKISKLKFCPNGDFLLFSIDYFSNKKRLSSALYFYRVRNKTLAQAASFFTLGDFHLVRRNRKNAIAVTFSRERQYCDSLGFISIDR